MTEKRPSPMVLRYFLLLFLLAMLMAVRVFWPFLSVMVLSYLLTAIFKPVYDLLHRRLSANLASLLTCLLIVLLVFLPLIFFIGALSREAYALYLWAKDADLAALLNGVQESSYLAGIQEMLARYGISLATEGIGSTLSEIARTAGLFMYDQARAWAGSIMQFLFHFFMMIIVIFFLLIDHARLLDYIVSLSPLPDRQDRRLFRKFEEIAGAVLIGNGICGIIQGALGGLLFAVLGLGPPVLWGGIMAVLAFLPIFGIGMVLVPQAIMLFIKGKTALAVFVGVFYIVVAFFVDNILKNRMVGEKAKMHSLLVFLAVMGGMSTFGFLGIIYGPLIITAFLTMAEIYRTSYYEAVVRGGDRA